MATEHLDATSGMQTARRPALTGGGSFDQCPAAIPEKGEFLWCPVLQDRAATPNSPLKVPSLV
jgi:hypothetical protein